MRGVLSSLRWCLRWWIVIPLALLIVWLVATVQTQKAIDVELAAIRAKGEPLTLAELAPRIPPGEPNAALLYENAFSFLMPNGNINYADYDRCLADLDFARQHIAARQTAIHQLHQAADMKYCAFPTDWTQPMYELAFPYYGPLREVARLLSIESRVLAADGRADESVASAAAAYRVGEHAMADPVLISTLVGYAAIGIAHQGLEESLSLTDPSPAACRQAFDILGGIDVDTPFRRALLGERASGIEMFDDIRAGRMPMSKLMPMASDGPESRNLQLLGGLYTSIGRPLFNADEVHSLEIHAGIAEAADLDWSKSNAAFEANDERIYEFPAYSSLITQMIFPVYSRAGWGKYRAAARLAVDRAALSIKAYKAEMGRYPDSLEQVRARGWTLPDDPFSGKPLLYRREDDGFIVWSVGPNVKDDGGVEYDPSQRMDYTSGPYDITFICSRKRVEAKRAERKEQWEQEQAAMAQQQAEEAARQSAPPRGARGDGRGRGRGGR